MWYCLAWMAVPRSDAMGREWLRNRAGVLAEPNFRRYYAGYVTSLLGSSMSTVATSPVWKRSHRRPMHSTG